MHVVLNNVSLYNVSRQELREMLWASTGDWRMLEPFRDAEPLYWCADCA